MAEYNLDNPQTQTNRTVRDHPVLKQNGNMTDLAYSRIVLHIIANYGNTMFPQIHLNGKLWQEVAYRVANWWQIGGKRKK